MVRGRDGRRGAKVKTRHYQVWLRGSDLCDVKADNKTEARKLVKKFYRYERLPKGTCVIEISPDYYDKIVENNEKIGIDFTNW